MDLFKNHFIDYNCTIKPYGKKSLAVFFILNSSVKKYFVLFFLPQDYALGWVNLYKKFEIGNYTVYGKLILPKKGKAF